MPGVGRGATSAVSDHVALEGQAIVPRLAERSEAPVEVPEIGSPPESGPRWEAGKAPLPPRPVQRCVPSPGSGGPYAPRSDHGDPARMRGRAMCLTGEPDGPARTPGVPAADSAVGSPGRRVGRTAASACSPHRDATGPRPARADAGMSDAHPAWPADLGVDGLAGGTNTPRHGAAPPPSGRRTVRVPPGSDEAAVEAPRGEGAARRAGERLAPVEPGVHDTTQDALGPGARGRKDSMQQLADAETPSLARGG